MDSQLDGRSVPVSVEPSTERQRPRTRRALLAGLLGGAGAWAASAIGRVGIASAGVGDPVRAGLNTTAGSATTTVTNSSDNATLEAVNNGKGAALHGDADGGNGAFARTRGANKHGLIAIHGSANAGTGAAIQATGNQNDGVVADTSNGSRHAIRATNPAGIAGMFDGELEVTGAITSASLRSGSSSASGTVIRALTDGATSDDLHPGAAEDPENGEFAGTNGIVAATSAAGYGLLALAPLGTAVRAKSVVGTAVEATSAAGHALSAVSGGGYGVYAASTDTLAGYFDGPVRSASADAAVPGMHVIQFVADGVAILAENTSSGTGTGAGSGIRALSGGATAVDLEGTTLPDAAGEFAGPVGVIGVTNVTDGSPAYGVVGISTAHVGVHGFSTSYVGVFGMSTSGTGVYGSSDTGDAGFFQGSVNVSAHLQLQSVPSDPGSAPSGSARLFARTNGSGKVELCVRFPSGAVQILTTEP